MYFRGFWFVGFLGDFRHFETAQLSHIIRVEQDILCDVLFVAMLSRATAWVLGTIACIP